MFLFSKESRAEMMRDAIRQIIFGLTLFAMISAVCGALMLAHAYLQRVTGPALAAIGMGSEFEKLVILFQLFITVIPAALILKKGIRASADRLLSTNNGEDD